MIPPRKEVLSLSEVIHGAVDRTELAGLGIDPATMIDFSASVNPFGPSPDAIAAMATSSIHCYPDRDMTELRQALAHHLGVPMECVVAGNGVSELLYLIALAFFRPADNVLIVGPTYSEYARVTQLMGATVCYRHADAESNFCFPASGVAEALRTRTPKAVFACHPNNPTGQLIPVDVVLEWADEFPETLFVIDEAYIEFSPGAVYFTKTGRDNIVVLRSMTKAYGLAGLRLGYAVSNPDVIKLLTRVRPPWSVNTIAQVAGVAALNDAEYLRTTLASISVEKEVVIKGLTSLGMTILPSLAHFFLIHVANATAVRQQLMNSAILVRDCTSFGMPEYVRISPQKPHENRLFCEACKRIVVKTAGQQVSDASVSLR